MQRALDYIQTARECWLPIARCPVYVIIHSFPARKEKERKENKAQDLSCPEMVCNLTTRIQCDTQKEAEEKMPFQLVKMKLASSSSVLTRSHFHSGMYWAVVEAPARSAQT